MTRYNGREEFVEVAADGRDLVFRWQVKGSRKEPIVMARFVPEDRLLRIFPRTRSGEGLVRQFSQVTELQLDSDDLTAWEPEELVVDGDAGLEMPGLPKGFSKMFMYGLGLRRRYRGIVHAIEGNSECSVVRFGDPAHEGPVGPVFHVHLGQFLSYKHAIDLNHSRGTVVISRVNKTESHNAIAEVLGLEPRKPTVGRHPIIQAITRELLGEPAMDADDRRNLMTQVAAESKVAAREAPAEFGKLRHDIELVSLETLIGHFGEGLRGDRSKDEAHWQRFFETNPFALQQLFAAPVALYGSQLTVKSSNAEGKGERIADFILVNTVTQNALVVEIKTPRTDLTGPHYRGKGGAEVYPPHRDLAAAIAQVQAQIESAQLHLARIVSETPGWPSLDTCVVQGAVLAGTISTLTTEQRQSFMRYRNGLAGVEVLAFDEVLDRLKGLHQLLANSPADR
ncbi:Shedu anti-phage system protein SduA domain-containing protein [Kribbella sp. WER1]